MNSVLSLINFLLLYNLTQSRYDKIMFLLILRLLYIDNYKAQLYNSPNMVLPNTYAKDIPNNFKYANASTSDNVTLNNNDLNFSPNPYSQQNYNNPEHHSTNNMPLKNEPTNVSNENIKSADHDNVEYAHDSDSLNSNENAHNSTANYQPNIDSSVEEDINNNEDNMLYDLDSLLYFLMIYKDQITNYDSVILILLTLNYYIKLFLYPMLSEELEPNTDAINNNLLSEKISIHNDTYDLTSTIKQIQLSNNAIVSDSKSENKISYNISTQSSKVTTQVPVLLTTCAINNIFKGDLIFTDYITDINNINNMIYITSSTLIVDSKNNELGGTLFLDGYLKTILDSVIPVNYSSNILSSMYRNNIICTPFSLTQNVNLTSNNYQTPMAYNNLEINISEISSSTKRILKDSKKINTYFDFYNCCELIIEVIYNINLYKLEDLSL